MSNTETEQEEIDWEAIEQEAQPEEEQQEDTDKEEDGAPEEAPEDEKSEEEPDEDEKKKFGERAQKRIQRLVAQRKAAEEDARAAREEAERIRSEAEELRRNSKSTEDHALTQHKQRLDVAEEALNARWESAADKDDRKEMWEIQKQLARVESERLMLETYEGQRPTEEQEDDAAPVPEPAREAKPSPPPVPGVIKNWVQQNSWFGTDEEMTKAALKIDNELIAEGYDPAEAPARGETSNEYLNELQARLAKEMPGKFGGKKKTSPVGGNTRNTTQRKTKSGLPRLTQSEMDLARRLGISPKAYAEQKKTIQQRGS